jgi:hypothetical protein
MAAETRHLVAHQLSSWQPCRSSKLLCCPGSRFMSRPFVPLPDAPIGWIIARSPGVFSAVAGACILHMKQLILGVSGISLPTLEQPDTSTTLSPLTTRPQSCPAPSPLPLSFPEHSTPISDTLRMNCANIACSSPKAANMSLFYTAPSPRFAGTIYVESNWERAMSHATTVSLHPSTNNYVHFNLFCDCSRSKTSDEGRCLQPLDPRPAPQQPDNHSRVAGKSHVRHRAGRVFRLVRMSLGGNAANSSVCAITCSGWEAGDRQAIQR